MQTALPRAAAESVDIKNPSAAKVSYDGQYLRKNEPD